jgi:sugar transferase (PEP-CTERM/EpsH1 system associated)
MNILFLAPRLPLPADTGGKIRTLNILKQLAKDNHICLLCFSFEESDHFYAQTLKESGIEVQLVPMSPISLFEKVTGVIFNKLPFSISKYHTKQMGEQIYKLLAKQCFDAIHIDHLHMAVYKDCFKNIPCFLDEHNVEYKILERCALVEKSWPKRMLYNNQSKKMKRFELQKIKEFNGVFACSIEDQWLLKVSDKTPIHVIPNGVDTEFFNLQQNLAKEDALVFTGSMDWLPNDDAITYFCKEILPIVWQKYSAIKLYVVGKNPSKLVKELAENDKRVEVTGRVDDVRPFVARSKVFIVPLRIGGGTRLKILEAMAMGKAIVSTTIGAEGIECKDGLDIAIADTPDTFAQKIIDLTKQSEVGENMGLKGRNLVCQKYDWSIVGKKLNTIYREAAHANN